MSEWVEAPELICNKLEIADIDEIRFYNLLILNQLRRSYLWPTTFYTCDRSLKLPTSATHLP